MVVTEPNWAVIEEAFEDIAVLTMPGDFARFLKPMLQHTSIQRYWPDSTETLGAYTSVHACWAQARRRSFI